ncbi:MAG: permease-like cell division protein FtsX [Bacteroidales bacterium]|nr:permease-like cell division protein FtsX [Bacteroidales bacterium]
MDKITFVSISKWKITGSYITTIISVSLVLFMIGLVGLLWINAHRISNHVKENIGFSIILQRDVKQVDILRLQKELDASSFSKSTKFVDAETAAHELKNELGEDFVDFIGYNPLLASIDVKLNAKYANLDSMRGIKYHLLNYSQVQDVYYQKSLVDLVNKNVKRISVFLILFSIIFILIAYGLISNTVRLSVYAQRFLINTKKLVGATKTFIRQPFLVNSIVSGVIGAGIAMFFLIIVVTAIQKEFHTIVKVSDFGLLLLALMIIGAAITGISSYFAVNKYLNLRRDDLYYQ